MNEEQIRDAADTAYLEDYFPLNEDPDHHWDIFNNGFIKGARWHESLPLADRLSESEIENLKAIYWRKTIPSMPDINAKYVEQALLEAIFGKSLFTPTEQ